MSIRGDRPFAATILILLVLTALLHLLGAGPLRDSFWGAHVYAFLPLFWLITAIILLAALAVWAELVGGGRLETAHWPDPSGWSTGRRLGAAAAAVIASGLLFWIARARHLILGDGSTLVVSVAAGEAFHPREPLTALFQQWFYRAGGGLFGAGAVAPESVAQSTTALSSVIAGTLFVPVAYALARELVLLGAGAAGARVGAAGSGDPALRAATILVWPLLIFQGSAVLFFGYVENYTWYTFALALWLWLSLRAARLRGSLLLPGAALLLALLFHLSAIVLVPAFLVLIVSALRRPESRRAAVRDLILGLVLVAASAAGLALLAKGYNLFGTLGAILRSVASGEGESARGYLLSARHLRDFLNEQLLIGPLGALLLIPAAVVAIRRRAVTSAATLLLLVAGGVYLVGCWIAGESNLGYPRNWDLLAPASLVFTAAGLGLFLAAGGGPARRAGAASRGAAAEAAHTAVAPALPILLIAVALSLYHTAPWIAINASFDRSFARLKTLPSPDGITQTNVARWYQIRGDREQAAVWLRKALEANPNNHNALYLRGKLALDRGDFAAAVTDLARAVALRPYKSGYREALVEALLSAGRWKDAARQAETLIAGAGAGTAAPTRSPVAPVQQLRLEAMPPGRLWALYGIALAGEGRDGDAAAALARFKAIAPGDTASAGVVARFYQARGDEALQAGRLEAAAAAYRQALDWNAGLYSVCFNLGLLLHEAGRDAEARPYLERALRLQPSSPDAAQIRALLGSSGGH